MGFNRVDKTDPKFCFNDNGKQFCTIHAEMAALQRAKNLNVKNFNKARIYVARKFGLPSQDYGMAKPCSRCAKMLYEHGFKARNVWFTDWNGEWQNLSSWDEYPGLA